MPDKYVIVKALLAVILGALAIAGMFVLKNPDGNHFVGALRDSLRVARTIDQLEILVNAVRQLVSRQPSSAKGNLMSELAEKQIIPQSMIEWTPKGLVVLSPWHTKITSANERGSFGITIPTSQVGCVKILASLSNSRASGVSVNGQRLKLPINNDYAMKNCIGGQPVPDVTFWFTFQADGKS